MAINSKVEICNMALSHLGNTGSVNDIDLPVTDKELIFALWYDIARQYTLKLLMPNFALARKTVAKANITPVFGYQNAFPYPSDCLKLLGVGNIDAKEAGITVEGGYIYSGCEWPNGLPIRFIKDIKDVNAFSPEFKIELSFELAKFVALPITQDTAKAKLLTDELPAKRAALSGMNAQENPPIRKSSSRFRQARYSNQSMNPYKQ